MGDKFNLKLVKTKKKYCFFFNLKSGNYFYNLCYLILNNEKMVQNDKSSSFYNLLLEFKYQNRYSGDSKAGPVQDSMVEMFPMVKQCSF